MKIMASGPITWWVIDGGKVETVTDFNFLGSKITADGDCSQEIKRCLLLGRKAMTHLDSILKQQRHYFANIVHLVKAMVFPVVMYGCESWTIKKADHQRIDAFELWCWYVKYLLLTVFDKWPGEDTIHIDCILLLLLLSHFSRVRLCATP